MEAIKRLDSLKTSSSSDIDVKNWVKRCYSAMNDDFNTPILIAELFNMVKFINQVKIGKANVSSKDLDIMILKLKEFVFEVLGLEKNNNKLDDSKLESTIKFHPAKIKRSISGSTLFIYSTKFCNISSLDKSLEKLDFDRLLTI